MIESSRALMIEFLYNTPLWVMFLVLVVLFPLATLFGHWVGTIVRARHSIQLEPSNFVPTTSLGLLALILGFTFSMSVSRYDSRNRLILDEANAIGTAYLRADTLPEPWRGRIKKNLRDYVPVRLEFLDTGIDAKKLEEVNRRTTDIQNRIWKDVAELAQKDRGPIMALFIAAMNSVIDIGGERMFSKINRVPDVVYVIILMVTLIGIASLGFIEGVGGQDSRFGVITLTILFAVVIVLIQDLDRPSRGLIQASQQSLYDLKDSMKD